MKLLIGKMHKNRKHPRNFNDFASFISILVIGKVGSESRPGSKCNKYFGPHCDLSRQTTSLITAALTCAQQFAQSPWFSTFEITSPQIQCVHSYLNTCITGVSQDFDSFFKNQFIRAKKRRTGPSLHLGNYRGTYISHHVLNSAWYIKTTVFLVIYFLF